VPESADHGLGRSRGGLTTKVHLACEQGQKPLSIVITAGQRGDSPQFVPVLAGIGCPASVVVAPAPGPIGCWPTRHTPPAPTVATCDATGSRQPFPARATRSLLNGRSLVAAVDLAGRVDPVVRAGSCPRADCRAHKPGTPCPRRPAGRGHLVPSPGPPGVGVRLPRRPPPAAAPSGSMSGRCGSSPSRRSPRGSRPPAGWRCRPSCVGCCAPRIATCTASSSGCCPPRPSRWRSSGGAPAASGSWCSC
jgi:hypothetical protein